MTAATESSKRFVSSEEEMRQTHHVHEENVREMEQIRHTNATLDMAGADSFRAQTEQAAIKIVTPFYKLGEKPSAEVQLGSSVADLSARFARADSDYKAERSAEHFRLQIIEPKVISHAHIPAHATRDYARRHLITDFPSLHGKRSFIDLEAIEQRKLRQQRQLPEAGDRDRDLDKFLKVREEKEQWKTPWPAPKPDDESLRELDRLRHNIDQLQKASMRRSKSLDELRPVKAAQVPFPPSLPLRRTILEPKKAPPDQHNRRLRSRSAGRRRRRRCRTTRERGWRESASSSSSSSSSETAETETDEESWCSADSVQHQTGGEKRGFGGSDFCCRETSEARQRRRRRRTLFARQPEDVAPLCHDQALLNGTEKKKPVPKQRRKQLEDKAVQAEEVPPQHYQQQQQKQQYQQQQPLRRRDFLLVAREHGADIHEWSSTSADAVAAAMERHVPAAEGTSSSAASLPSPPKSILRQPQHQHQHQQQQKQLQQQQQQHQYTIERRGEDQGHYWEDRGEIGITGGGGGGDDAEEQRALYEAMQRNLALHRQPSPHPDLYPSVPFNGPFFRLHELSPDGRASRPLTALPSGAAVSKTMPTTPSYHHNTLPPASPRRPPPGRTTAAVSNNAMAPSLPPPPPGWTTRQLQEQRPDNHRLQQHEDEGEEEGLVVVWPPFPGQDIDHQQRRPKPEVPPPKNVRDNAQEYARQERMQAEAERQRAERDARLREKQFQAVKLQQDQLTRLATQQQASPADTGIGASEPEQHATSTSASSANRPGTSHSQSQLLTPSVAAVRVYETRPMAPDAGDAYDARFMTHPNAADEFAYDARFTPAANGAATYDMLQQSPGSITWRRTYVVDTEHVDERNEILTSEERLARDRFEIDLLRRRAQFIEKPEQPVEIRRTGKRWQPPPEKPYRWPNPSTVAVPVEDYGPLSVQVNGNAVDEHRWVPVVRQPVFKSETRDFVPDEPEQQIKGHGAGPLEDVVQRQTAGVVVPSPDGSHRPKAEFGGARKPPAGGFIPHAPNVVVRRARTRALHPEELAAGSASDAMPRRRRHATGGSAGRVRHASAAARSVTGDMYHPTEEDAEYHPDEDWEAVAPPRQQQQQRRATTVVTIDANRAAAPGPTMNGVDDDLYQEEEMLYTEEMPRHTSTVVSLGPLPRTDVRRTIRALEVRDRKERSRSALARARADRSRSPSAQRAHERIRQLTQASPTPASYEHARKYVPPALPTGHREPASSAAPDLRDAIPKRHARRMADVVQREASVHAHNREPLAAKLAPAQFRRRSGTSAAAGPRSALMRTESSGRNALRVAESPPLARGGRHDGEVYSNVRPIGDRVPSSAMRVPRGWTTEAPPPTDGEVRSYRASRTVEHRRVQRRN